MKTVPLALEFLPAGGLGVVVWGTKRFLKIPIAFRTNLAIFLTPLAPMGRGQHNLRNR